MSVITPHTVQEPVFRTRGTHGPGAGGALGDHLRHLVFVVSLLHTNCAHSDIVVYIDITTRGQAFHNYKS